jgi:hypothetical protein
LSKPETKTKYDTERARLLRGSSGGSGVGSSSAIGNAASKMEVPDSFSMQRANYAQVQVKASSNWEALRVKYKTEKWQNMPLEARKV